MGARNPRDFMVEPPLIFDGRMHEDWTVAELETVVRELERLTLTATGEELDSILARQSAVLRCIGHLALVLCPPRALQDEWEQACADANHAEDFSPERLDALNRQAEVERACGADVLLMPRDYRGGDEPVA